MKKKIAFIICNGESRVDLDLTSLKKYGKLYGCNLLCTEYPDGGVPDLTVAMENYRREQLNNLKLPKEKLVFPPENELYEELDYWREITNNPNIPDGTPTPRSNSGMLAMKDAIKKGFDTLYILGFDCVIEGPESVSNLMTGKPETRASYEDTKRRVMYFVWFASKNPKINFKIVIPQRIQKIRNVLSDNTSILFYKELFRSIEKDRK